MRTVQVSRMRPFLGQVTLTPEERASILAQIDLSREMMAEVNRYTQGVPTWATVDPFGKNQPRFDEVLNMTYEVNDAVSKISARLANPTGPWPKLSDAEVGALSTFRNGIDEMYSIYQSAKPDANADVRVAASAGVIGILYTIAIMGA